MDVNEVPEYIEEQVNEYKNETYDLLDYTKIVFFAYLVKRYGVDKFRKKIEKEFDNYDKRTVDRLEKNIVKIDKIMANINDEKKTPSILLNKPSEEDIKSLLFKLDTTSTKKSREVFIKRIENFYKETSKTLKKEYIQETEYLSKKVSQYDKIQKVVPYYNKDGTVRAHFDIAGYNSMVYNTNLTASAWNSTIKNAQRTGNDLVYVEPHPFSCPLCQEWQGKIYSVSTKNPIYPHISIALDGGLKHPNCKHAITEYTNQEETSKYTSGDWVDRYNARQKKQSLELERKRLKNDREIFKKLGNNEEVDKLNQKISKLNQKITEQKNIMR